MKPIIQTCLLVSMALAPILSHPLSLVAANRIALLPYSSQKAFALPPPEDIPEEVLRTEVILEGRSPIDGKSLSAKEYEELKTELAQSINTPKINSDIQERIFLLQLRKLVKTIIPFY